MFEKATALSPLPALPTPPHPHHNHNAHKPNTTTQKHKISQTKRIFNQTTRDTSCHLSKPHPGEVNEGSTFYGIRLWQIVQDKLHRADIINTES